MLYVFYPLKQFTVSELRHTVDIYYICIHGYFLHHCYIGSTFPVHLDVSSFPIGETPIRIDGFFEDELLTLATVSIVISPPGGKRDLDNWQLWWSLPSNLNGQISFCLFVCIYV